MISPRYQQADLLSHPPYKMAEVIASVQNVSRKMYPLLPFYPSNALLNAQPKHSLKYSIRTHQ